MSGTGYPGLEVTKEDARTGMNDLPWVVGLGPQLVYKLDDSTHFNLAVFQATSTDFKMTKFNGAIFQGKLHYQWQAIESLFTGHLFLIVKGGSKDFLSIYYDVSAAHAVPNRSEYEAKAGYLSDEITYLISYQSGRAKFYTGASYINYANSVNRSSPLHKSDANINYLFAITYVLSESERDAVLEDDTKGIIRKR